MVTNSWTGNTVPPVGDANEMLTISARPAAEADVSDGERSAIPMQEEVELEFGVGLQIRLKPPPTTVPLVLKYDEQAKVPVEMGHAESSQDGDCSSGVPVLTPIVCDPVDCDVLLGGRILWR